MWLGRCGLIEMAKYVAMHVRSQRKLLNEKKECVAGRILKFPSQSVDLITMRVQDKVDVNSMCGLIVLAQERLEK